MTASEAFDAAADIAWARVLCKHTSKDGRYVCAHHDCKALRRVAYQLREIAVETRNEESK